MTSCKDCVHVEVCGAYLSELYKRTHLLAPDPEVIRNLKCDDCEFFKDRSRFVELPHAEWDEREDMYGDPVYCCSNCREKFFLEEWTPIENRYFYCPNCGAKMDEQSLKEREENETDN